MASKAKGKDDKSKKSAEDSEELDLALLRKPISTSATGLAHAGKIFELATEELKELLANECDILYECKVCRNIFRSLANFISHKRVYCKEKFNTSLHGHFVTPPPLANELQRIQDLEDSYRKSLLNINVDNADDDDDDRIPMTKDLTTIVEKITKNKALSIYSKNNDITFRRIHGSSVAVFQNVYHDKNDNMQEEVNEITNILSRDKAVLQSDGTFRIQTHVNFRDHENVIQISDDEDGENLKCKTCDQKFSTMKTLKFHMKYKHLDSRLVYPCPDCLEIFSTSWSVYRHLFKVHRKSAAQIRKLREAIQAKAFKLNNPPAFYEKHKSKSGVKSGPNQNMTEEERLDQENQEWIDKMECDGEVPRCGGCGRTFERRAALSAHTQTCQSRSRALTRKPDNKKIEIQVRKDYMKTPTGKVLGDAKQKLEEKSPNKDESNEVVELKESVSPEPYQFVMDDIVPSIQLPFAQQTEKSNMTALKQKMEKDIELTKLSCKICSQKHNHIQKLFDHMGTHYKWMRYACKLCNFKHYFFDRLPVHVKEVHKLKGDSDFYFSTVKAIDGPEALELIENEDQNNENSSDSRRPSSDSSRISEDSSPVVNLNAVKKRKLSVPTKANVKRRKDDAEDDVSVENGDTDFRNMDENSSDMDDIEEKLQKRISSREVKVPIRRPVRKRTIPKNADFEYDLSNLLKMEAQGYSAASSKTVTTASTPTKTVQSNTNPKIVSIANIKTVTSTNVNPKTLQSSTVSKTTPPSNSKTPIKDKKEKERKTNTENVDYPTLVKQCYGALAALTRKSVMKGQAHLKTVHAPITTTKRQNIFMRPRDVPKILARGDKASPRKDEAVKCNDSTPGPIISATSSVDSALEVVESTPPSKPSEPTQKDTKSSSNTSVQIEKSNDKSSDNKGESPVGIRVKNRKDLMETAVEDWLVSDSSNNDKEQNKDNVTNTENNKSPLHIPNVTSIKLGNESIEKVMSNPILNKNIHELKKAGLKTKILVIKPINRNKDGTQSLNSQLKFQTIKLKDSNKNSTEDSSGEQVLFVKVPKVECAVRNANEKNTVASAKTLPSDTTLTASDKNIVPSAKALPADTTLTINDPEKNDTNEIGEKEDDLAEIVNTNKTLNEVEKPSSCENSELNDTVVVIN